MRTALLWLSDEALAFLAQISGNGGKWFLPQASGGPGEWNRLRKELEQSGLARQGFDGIIHVKSFGCTPETDVIPVLQNISQDYHIPILYLSYDTQNSDTGLDTRLEAFCDMLERKKKVLR